MFRLSDYREGGDPRASVLEGGVSGACTHIVLISNMIQVSRTLMFVCFYDGDFETACMFGRGFGAVRMVCGWWGCLGPCFAFGGYVFGAMLIVFFALGVSSRTAGKCAKVQR